MKFKHWDRVIREEKCEWVADCLLIGQYVIPGWHLKKTMNIHWVFPPFVIMNRSAKPFPVLEN
jgi:hypothetical protein